MKLCNQELDVNLTFRSDMPNSAVQVCKRLNEELAKSSAQVYSHEFVVGGDDQHGWKTGSGKVIPLRDQIHNVLTDKEHKRYMDNCCLFTAAPDTAADLMIKVRLEHVTSHCTALVKK